LSSRGPICRQISVSWAISLFRGHGGIPETRSGKFMGHNPFSREKGYVPNFPACPGIRRRALSANSALRPIDPFADSGRGGPPRSTSAVLVRGYKPRACGEPKARPLMLSPAFQGGAKKRGSGLTPNRPRHSCRGVQGLTGLRRRCYCEPRRNDAHPTSCPAVP